LTSRYSGYAAAEDGSPDKFAQAVSSGAWIIAGIRRSGRFARQSDLVNDDALVESVGGHTGASSLALNVRSSPERHVHWEDTKAKVGRVLVGAPVWQVVVPAWIDEMAKMFPRAELVGGIFNPCDFLGAIVNQLTSDGGESLPHFQLVIMEGENCRRLLEGTLTWKGEQRASLFDAVEAVFDGDLSVWAFARTFGDACSYEEDLTDMLGVAYTCFEFLPSDPSAYILSTVKSGTIGRQRTNLEERDGPLLPLRDWLAANATDLRWVVDEMAGFTHGIFPGLD
jgi:hypothetical protein